MSIVPQVPAHVMLRKLKRAGFEVVHQRGSHAKLHHPDTERTVTIPIHPGDLSKKIVGKILKQAGISVKEFLNL